jgi:predicted ATP-dependent protease
MVLIGLNKKHISTSPPDTPEGNEQEPIEQWIEKQSFTTTADIQVPERLLDQVIGQDKAVDVVRKAAEQKRHVMLIGDPGTGKSMVSRAMTEFLPKEELEDIIAYPNSEDTNTPHIRVVPGGKGKEIVKAQRAEAKKEKRTTKQHGHHHCVHDRCPLHCCRACSRINNRKLE